MKSHSTLPQELYRSRPRAVRLTGGGWALSVTAIVLCLAAPVVAILLQNQAVRDRVERDALLHSGVVTDGVVTRLRRESKDSNRASVYYQFAANGRTFEARAKVPIARWKALSVGSSLPIRHLDANPALSIPDGVVPSVLPSALPYIVSPLPLVPGLLCWLGLRYQRRLLSEGRAAMAIVTKVTKHRTQHGGSYRHVRYEFPLLSGAVQTGSVQTSAAAPEVGSTIAVVYDAERPRRSRPYPLSLVRLAESD
ncbi:MAG: hypothetical protein EPO35_00540 [Acidobacteria bacterium]|nr:MAG: hypothetical protein EPO35_00540 [Acidobacteriota bacterium]